MCRGLWILVFLASIGSVVQADFQCMEETGFSGDEFTELNIDEMPALYDGKLACYHLCVKKKEGKANSDGTLIYPGETGDTLSDRMQLQDIFDRCKNEKTITDNPCRTFFNMYSCVSQTISDMEFKQHLETFETGDDE